VNRRVRAAAFTAGALACAGLSAAVAGSAEAPDAGGFGALRPVVVAAVPLERGTVLTPRALKGSVTERRVPEDFVPPDALGAPEEVLSRRLAINLPPGSYLTASAFKAPGARGSLGDGPPKGTTPVEITVTGAGALAAARADPGDQVDVVVSGDSTPGPTAGSTYVAARSVPLLGLSESEAETGLESNRWIATLALYRPQALALIRAESTGAQLRLLAR